MELVTIDTATNRIVARTPTGDFPDGVAYDRDDALVFVSDKNAGSITVISAGTGKVTATIKVGARPATSPTTHPPGPSTRPPAPRTHWSRTNPTSRKVTSRIRLSGCDGAHGVYIEPRYQQAFVACERNARLVVVDLEPEGKPPTSRSVRVPTSSHTTPRCIAFMSHPRAAS